jgi:hypothetical protein
MNQQRCLNCGRIGMGGCPQCDAQEQRTVVLGEVEEDQRTVLITGRPRPPVVVEEEPTVLITGRPRPPVVVDEERTVVVTPDLLRSAPAKPPQWGAPPPHSPAPASSPAHPQHPPLAEGYPEELTTSLTGSLLGARALPPRPVPKTSYRMVVPVLIFALLFAIAVGMAVTMMASGVIEDFFQRIITAG